MAHVKGREFVNGVVDCPMCGAWHTILAELGEIWSVCGCPIDSDGFDAIDAAFRELNPEMTSGE